MNTTSPDPARVSDGNVAYPDHQILNLNQNLRDIYRCFGPETVLIPVPRGLAQPRDAWKRTTLAQSQATKHQAALWNSDGGVACGPLS